MLGKLLKYDLKWVGKIVVIFYILAIIFSIFTRILLNVENSLLFTIIGQISSGIMISMLISSLINGFMRSWVRFVRNVYKDESYLTHTLPIGKKTIYLSKVLTAIICAFTTVIIATLCIFISYYSQDNIKSLQGFLELAANNYDTTIINLLFVVSFVVFLEIVFIILIGYVGIIIGYKSNNNKTAKSVITGFVLYICTSLLTLVIVYFIGLFNTDVMNVINTTNIVKIDAIKSIMTVGIIIYLIYDIIYYIIGKKLLEKGVNVD